METYNKQYIRIGSDLELELHHNATLNNKPFLLKVFSYNGCSEHRLNRAELLDLSQTLAEFAFDKTTTSGYNPNCDPVLYQILKEKNNDLEDTIEYLQKQLGY